jgi:hypothetical protein
MPPETTIEAIIAALKTEDEYQLKRWGTRTSEGLIHTPHTLHEWIVFMRHFLRRAESAVTTQIGQEQPLHELRKVAMMAIQALRANCGLLASPNYLKDLADLQQLVDVVDKSVPKLVAKLGICAVILSCHERLEQATQLVVRSEPFDKVAAFCIQPLLLVCLACFRREGCPHRPEEINIVNVRDGDDENGWPAVEYLRKLERTSAELSDADKASIMKNGWREPATT